MISLQLVRNNKLGFSLMAPIISIVGTTIIILLLYKYSENWLTAIVWGGILSLILGWVIGFMLDFIFNNPLALKLQNGAWNHSCPNCMQKYEEYISTNEDNETIILSCLKCGAKNRFTKKYKHIEFISLDKD